MFSNFSQWYKTHISFRHYFAFFGTLIALVALFGSSPGAGLINVPFGADVIAKLSTLPASVFAVFFLHIGIWALYDYLNLKKVAEKAAESSNGAGLLMIAVSLSRLALAVAVIGIVSIFQ